MRIIQENLIIMLIFIRKKFPMISLIYLKVKNLLLLQ